MRSSCRSAPRAASSPSSLPRRRPRDACRPRASPAYKILIMRPARHHRQSRRRRQRRAARRTSCATTATIPIWWSRPTRAPPPSPTSPTASPRNTASGWATLSPRAVSQGYDHKDMGITARGAWEAVKRHFREIGTRHPDRAFHRASASATCRATCSATACCCRAQTGWSPPSTTATSSSIPSPIRRRSLAERKRLFALPRSSWDDYDASR